MFVYAMPYLHFRTTLRMTGVSITFPLRSISPEPAAHPQHVPGLPCVRQQILQTFTSRLQRQLHQAAHTSQEKPKGEVQTGNLQSGI